MSDTKFVYSVNELSTGDIVWHPPDSSYRPPVFESFKVINPVDIETVHRVSEGGDTFIDIAYTPSKGSASR